jgi:hypothetical protein
MKQIIALFAFVALCATSIAAQPVMTIDQMTIDYGTIEKGSDPIRKFAFTNTGNEPLIIKDAKGSCGCTAPNWPKEPIMPGEKSAIEVRYDTNREGAFTKTVTLKTNEASDTHTLTIKGDVKPGQKQESVPVSTGGLKQ